MTDNQSVVYKNGEIHLKNTYVMLTKEKIGSGSFGEIYKGYNIKTKQKLAFKLELNSAKTPQLAQEYKVLKAMQGTTGFANIYHYSNLGEDTVLVMDLLGSNLEDILKQSKSKKFSLKSVLMIAEALITRIAALHEKDYIHRDLKPENCVIGLEDKENIVYLIDFGLSRKFRDSRTNEHIPYKEGKSILGTVRYVSIYTHFGIEQSRRDDIESLGYIFVYLAKGILPWQGQKAKTKKDKYKIIMDKKIEYKPEMLCHGLPDEFRLYFDYIRGVQFTEKPDYSYLKGLFNKVMQRLEYVNDLAYDWCKISLPPIDPYQNHEPLYDMAEIIQKLENLVKKSDNQSDNDYNEEKNDE